MTRRLTYHTLLRTALFLFAFALLNLSTYDAHGFQWKQTCDPHSASGNKCERGETARPLSWSEGCISFRLSGGIPLDRNAALTALDSAFSAWSRVGCSAISVSFEPQAPSDNHVEFASDDWEHSRTSFAVTAVSYNPNDGDIEHAEIEVNEDQYDFQARQSGPAPNAPDLQNTVTHEVGHALGFAHSDVVEATMFGGARTGETKKRSLHRDDIEGLCEFYDRSTFQGTCAGETTNERDEESKADGTESAEDPDEPRVGWGETGPSQDPSYANNEPACSVTSGAGSAKLPLVSLLLFIALSFLVRHGASTGANRKRGRSPGASRDRSRR